MTMAETTESLKDLHGVEIVVGSRVRACTEFTEPRSDGQFGWVINLMDRLPFPVEVELDGHVESMVFEANELEVVR